jgi:hypothetical protein
MPQLIVDVNTASDDRSLAYSINLSLWQEMYHARNPHMDSSSSTWTKTAMGICAESEFQEAVRNAAKDLVEQFINACLTANPKK